MTPDQVLDEFRDAEALLEGHFILSSGLHSRTYLQCARVLMDTRRAARLAEALAAKITDNAGGAIDCVVAPAMGGLIIGHEAARALNVDSMFLERVDGEFTLRRGFHLSENANVVMIEDIVTTGLSSREAIAAIGAHGGHVVSAGCLIDRSGGTADIGVSTGQPRQALRLKPLARIMCPPIWQMFRQSSREVAASNRRASCSSVAIHKHFSNGCASFSGRVKVGGGRPNIFGSAPSGFPAHRIPLLWVWQSVLLPQPILFWARILLWCAIIIYFIGGNFIAAVLGTWVGNPASFPFIWLATFNTGNFLLGRMLMTGSCCNYPLSF